MSCKDKWAGIKAIRDDLKARMYARKDREGKYIALGERAEATAEYLEKDQWSNASRVDGVLDIERRWTEN